MSSDFPLPFGEYVRASADAFEHAESFQTASEQGDPEPPQEPEPTGATTAPEPPRVRLASLPEEIKVQILRVCAQADERIDSALRKLRNRGDLPNNRALAQVSSNLACDPSSTTRVVYPSSLLAMRGTCREWRRLSEPIFFSSITSRKVAVPYFRLVLAPKYGRLVTYVHIDSPGEALVDFVSVLPHLPNVRSVKMKGSGTALVDKYGYSIHSEEVRDVVEDAIYGLARNSSRVVLCGFPTARVLPQLGRAASLAHLTLEMTSDHVWQDEGLARLLETCSTLTRLDLVAVKTSSAHSFPLGLPLPVKEEKAVWPALQKLTLSMRTASSTLASFISSFATSLSLLDLTLDNLPSSDPDQPAGLSLLLPDREYKLAIVDLRGPFAFVDAAYDALLASSPASLPDLRHVGLFAWDWEPYLCKLQARAFALAGRFPRFERVETNTKRLLVGRGPEPSHFEISYYTDDKELEAPWPRLAMRKLSNDQKTSMKQSAPSLYNLNNLVLELIEKVMSGTENWLDQICATGDNHGLLRLAAALQPPDVALMVQKA